MAGYNPQTLANRARNANTVAVQLGDMVVAFAQSVTHQFSFGTEQLYGVGSALPQDIQQMKVSPSIRLSMFALTADGLAALAGNTDIAYLLGNNQFDLHLVDGATNDVIFSYIGATSESFSETITANQPITRDIPFLAMDVWDPNGDSILISNSAVSVSALAATAISAAAGALGA